MTDLSSVKSIRQAYLAVGIIKDKAKEGIGTADVDLVKNFFAMLTRFESSTGKVFEIAKKVDPIEIGHERRAEIIEKTKPMIEFVDRIKAAEAA